MKESLVLLGMLFISSSAFAEATLKIPVIFEQGKYGTPADAINRKLKAIGAKPIPRYIEISNTENGYSRLKEIDSDISKSLSKLGKEYRDLNRLTGTMPSSIKLGGLKTCYKGAARDVSEAVLNLAGSEYTEQMNILGWKYKSTTKLLVDFPEGDLEGHLSRGSKLWKNWQPQGDAVLLLIAISDDGDDVNENLIERCAK